MIWDASLSGFGLDVWPSGRKSWILFYRVAGQQRRMTIGTADKMPPTQAVAAVHAALAQINRGIDPLAVRRGDRSPERLAAQRVTVSDVAARYLASLAARGSAKWAGEAERIYKTQLGPTLGARLVRDIAIKDARALHESLGKTPISANRAKAVLSAIMARAIEHGERPRELLNPAGAVEDYPETERDRYLTDDEWPRIAKAIRTLRKELRDIPKWDTRVRQLDALIMLALTGARLRSVLPRKWSDVDWKEHAIAVNPAHKGVSRIHMGAAAEDHLRGLLDARDDANEFIFPGQQRRIGKRKARYAKDTRPERAPSPVSSLGPTWKRLSELAELEGFTLHDWRRTFATVAGDVGVSDHMIGGLLGHRVPGVRRRYARRTDDALLEAAHKVAAEVAKHLELRVTRTRTNVPLPVKRKVR